VSWYGLKLWLGLQAEWSSISPAGCDRQKTKSGNQRIVLPDKARAAGGDNSRKAGGLTNGYV